jgi:hypothetical protein
MKMVCVSKRSGCGSDDIYTLSLWYYDQLLFLVDKEIPRPVVRNLHSEEDIISDEVWKHYLI